MSRLELEFMRTIRASQEDGTDLILKFARESSAIERIYDEEAVARHAQELQEFLSFDEITTDCLSEFVAKVQPGAVLRYPGLNVKIGGLTAPKAPECVAMLLELLRKVNESAIGPWDAHLQYEYIHPFSDGNGRSGRALWLWMMKRRGDLQYALSMPFLQHFYYQTLSDNQRKLYSFKLLEDWKY